MSETTLSIAFKFQKIGKIDFGIQKLVDSRKPEKNEKDSNYKKGPQHMAAQNVPVHDLIYNSYFDPAFL